MRRRDEMGAARAEMIDHRDAERAAFDRIGSGADFVQQHQRRQRQIRGPSTTTFVMCAENVLRLAEIDCSSPMSANSDLKTGSFEPGSAGTCRPACAIAASSPAVFSATVLPPVFGPVMISTRVGGTARCRPASVATGPTGLVLDVDAARSPRRHQQRMTRAAQLERAVCGDHRLHAADHDARTAPRAWMTSSSVADVDRPLEVVRPAAERVGQREQDAAHFLGFLLLERDDVVVDLDGLERLEEQAGAAGRAAVHDARDRAAMLGTNHQHVAAVAIGDDLLLQILRRVRAAQERFERRRAASLLLPAQPLADAGERRAGVVGDLAGRLDLAPHVGDLALERRDGFAPAASGSETRRRAVVIALRAIARSTRDSPASPSSRSGSSARPSTPSAVEDLARDPTARAAGSRDDRRGTRVPSVVARCAATTCAGSVSGWSSAAGRARSASTARPRTTATMRSNSRALSALGFMTTLIELPVYQVRETGELRSSERSRRGCSALQVIDRLTPRRRRRIRCRC